MKSVIFKKCYFRTPECVLGSFWTDPQCLRSWVMRDNLVFDKLCSHLQRFDIF